MAKHFISILYSLYKFHKLLSKYRNSILGTCPLIHPNCAIALRRKTKTNTNPNPDPNRYRRRCPDPNARIQKKNNSCELTDKHQILLADVAKAVLWRGPQQAVAIGALWVRIMILKIRIRPNHVG